MNTFKLILTTAFVLLVSASSLQANAFDDSAPLQRGFFGESVAQLQKLFVAEGTLSPEHVTGFFGDLTEKALQEFQEKYSIFEGSSPIDGKGIAGPKTFALITALRSAKSAVLGASTSAVGGGVGDIVSPVANSVVKGTIAVTFTGDPSTISSEVLVNGVVAKTISGNSGSVPLDTKSFDNGPMKLEVKTKTPSATLRDTIWVTVWNPATSSSLSNVTVDVPKKVSTLDHVDASLVSIEGKNDTVQWISSFGGTGSPWQKFDGNLTEINKKKVWGKYSHDLFGVTVTNPPVPYDHFWLVHAYQQGKNVLGFLHIEHKAKGTDNDTSTNASSTGTDVYEGRLGLAWSEDYGDTWEYIGDYMIPENQVATVNPAGAPYVIKDGYFYSYYIEAVKRGDGNTQRVVAVVRAKVKDVMAAAKTGDVTPWKKFYNGEWTSAGLGGPATGLIDVTAEGHVHTDAFYSLHTKKFYLLMVRSASTVRARDSVLNLFESSDGLHWKLSTNIATRPPTTTVAGKYDGYHYPFALDTTGSDNGTVGRVAYIYAPVFNPGLNGKNGFPVLRWKVTLGTGGSTATATSTVTEYTRSEYTATSTTPVWAYTYSPAPKVTKPMTWKPALGRWIGPSGSVWVDDADQLRPSTTTVFMQWIAPETGRVEIEGAPMPVGTGCESVYATTVRKQTTVLWKNDIQESSTAAFTVKPFYVKKGERITFSARKVKQGPATASCDVLKWDPTVTLRTN